jgi:hypothetical protein
MRGHARPRLIFRKFIPDAAAPLRGGHGQRRLVARFCIGDLDSVLTRNDGPGSDRYGRVAVVSDGTLTMEATCRPVGRATGKDKVASCPFRALKFPKWVI